MTEESEQVEPPADSCLLRDEAPFSDPPVVDDPALLLSYGVCRVPIPLDRIEPDRWARELSRATPLNLAFEGDGEYSFYRNILEEPDFPFDAVLDSPIGDAIVRHFGIKNINEEIRLDDAFCVHYNTEQEDTSGAKHLDPSDITVNICLEKTADVIGSQVMFYGTQGLVSLEQENELQTVNEANGGCCTSDGYERQPCTGDDSIPDSEDKDFRFKVEQKTGTATIHWGHHPHETLAMKGSGGRRTNVILTYCYTDPDRSDVGLRSCYAV